MPEENRAQRIPLYLAFFVIGYAAILAQVVLSREFLIVLGGNELVIGLIMAAWLLGIGGGAWLGAIAADRLRAERLFFLSAIALMALALPLQIALVRAARGMLGVAPGESIPLTAMLFFCPLATAPTGLLVGFVFPFAGRLGAAAGDGAPQGVADLYIAESAGSLAGGMLFTFFLVEILSPMQIAFLDAAVLAAGGYAVAMTLEKAAARTAVTSIFVALVAAGGLGVPGLASDLDDQLGLLRWREEAGEIEHVAAADSRYQHIDIGRTAEQYTLYLNGSASGYMPADYAREQLAHFLLAQHPDPKSVLIIGDGSEGLLQTLVRYPLKRIDYVLLDDSVPQLLAPFESPEHADAMRDARLSIHAGDGRRFLQRAELRWDMVIALVPPPTNALLNRYYTFEFFKEVRAKLDEGGVFILPLPITPGYAGGLVGSFAGSVVEGLEVVFPQIIYSPEPESYAFCSSVKGAVTSDVTELSDRWEARRIEGALFHEALFGAWLQPERVAERRAEIESLPVAGLNSDLHPTAYLYRLLIWNRTTAGERDTADAVNEAILGLRGMGPWLPAIFIAALLAAALAARQFQPAPMRRFIALAVISTTGFAAMALEIMLIFAYQNLFGYVYGEIGLIIALFMAGLAAGAWWSRRHLEGKEDGLRIILLVFEAAILALCILLPLTAGPAGHLITAIPGGRYLLIVLLGVAGFATGAQFPQAVRLYIGGREDAVGAGAGAIDSADHIGAALGAALTGVILLPVLGLWATALLLACLKAASAVILLRY